MTEKCVLGYSTFKRFLKSVYIVKTFSRVISFAEKVLINVRHCSGVRVNSSVAGKDARKSRPRSTLQRYADARLKNAVSGNDPIGRSIKLRLIERVNRRADKFPRHFARKLGVRIERNYIANPREQGFIRSLHHEAGIASATKQSVEFMQLPTFPLPTHPGALPFIPPSLAMENMKAKRLFFAITLIKFVDSAECSVKHHAVLGHLLPVSVSKVSQQSEVNMIVLIREEVDLKLFQKVVNGRLAGKKGWHNNHCASVFWYALICVNARQQSRMEKMCYVPIQ